MSKGLSIFCWAITLVLFIVLIIFGVYNYFVSYQYDKQIGSYMSNAIDMIAPEGMLQQVQLAKQGMIDAGLTENDYAAVWFKKPDNSMKFQYQHIDAIIERIQAVEDWKTKIAGNNTQIETLGDVYETKMTNLRNYINEGGVRSDWIAKDTWYIKNHIVVYFGFWIGFILITLMLLFGIIAAATWSDY
jgi:hypothetical protein